jgi:hypothetical protein
MAGSTGRAQLLLRKSLLAVELNGIEPRTQDLMNDSEK